MKTRIMALWLLTVFILIKCATAYTISGDSVYIDDSHAYLSATPHTLTEPGWVEFNFTSKTYTGDINVVLGVDTEQMRPLKVKRWNFVQQEWQDLNKEWSSHNHDLDGKNKWWMLNDVPVTAGQDYRIAIKFSVAHNLSAKYDFGIYPSSYGTDIISAYQAGHLYYLDPWFDSDWLYCREWQINETDGIDRTMMVVSHNLTGLTLLNNATEIRIINGTCLGGGEEIEYSLYDTDDTTYAAIQYWVNISASDSITYSVYYGNSDATNKLPYDSPPIMVEVDFPDGTNTTGSVNRTAPYIFDINTNSQYNNYVGYDDYFTGVGTTSSVNVHWYVHKNFLYYTDSDYADVDVINIQVGHRMNTGAWRSYLGVFMPRVTNSISGNNFDDGYSMFPIHYLADSYNLCQYLNGVVQYCKKSTSVGDTTNFVHTNYTYWSNGSVLMSTNTSSSNAHYNSSVPTTDFNGITVTARSGYAEAHWMRLTTGAEIYGTELSEYNLVLGALSPEKTQGTVWSPTELNSSMVETTTKVEYGWIANNQSSTNNTYNLSMEFNSSCFNYEVQPSSFDINGVGNQTVNWTFTEYRNCSTGTYTGRTLIYLEGEFYDEIGINMNVTEDENAYDPETFSMTINQGNLDSVDFNISNPNADTNSTFTYTDDFDVFCFSKTYTPTTYELNGSDDFNLNFQIGVNPLCPNTTYYGNITVYDDGFFDYWLLGNITVTNVTVIQPEVQLSIAGLNCSYSMNPYIRETIDWRCVLNTSSQWYCYGTVYWDNDPQQLISITPDSREFEDYGLLDYQYINGRLFQMRFLTTDLYAEQDYNFTVECTSALTNQTAHFSSVITPTFAEPRELLYRGVWLRDNTGYLIVMALISLLIILAIGYIVRKVKR